MKQSYLKVTIPAVFTLVAKGAAATTVANPVGLAAAAAITIVAGVGAYALLDDDDSKN